MSQPQSEYIPKWIAWEATQRCNLRCVHCRCSSDMSSSAGDFTFEEACKLIDDICEISLPVMVLSGGEPLMRPDIFDIARYGTDKGLRMCMATNGTLIDDHVCAQMKATGIRMVSLSLDGSTAAIHDDFRQCEGAFEGVLRAADTLKRHGIKFLVNSSFTKRNQHDIGNCYRLAKSLGATAWYMFMIVPTGRGEEIMEELVSKEDYEDLLKWHYEMEKAEDELLVRPTCAPHYYRIVPQMAKEQGVAFERRSLTFSTGGGKGCIAGQTICLIDCYGNLKPCSYFLSNVGNVKQTPFKELWFNSATMKQLRDFSQYGGKCGDCEYLKVCGGCRARADAVHGDFMAEEPFCSYVPPRYAKKQGA